MAGATWRLWLVAAAQRRGFGLGWRTFSPGLPAGALGAVQAAFRPA